jgi:hypothetical protein
MLLRRTRFMYNSVRTQYEQVGSDIFSHA